jgi:hypothetical protein
MTTLGGALLLGLFVLMLPGCEDDVLGPETHQYPYSMWGVLNPLSDVQYVRVFPVDATLAPGAPEPLDARFTSTDLGTGEQHTWRDSVTVDTAGVVGHLFYAPFQPEWEHRYRLEVTRGDGVTSSVEVMIPKRRTLVLGDPDTTRGVILPASIEGDEQRLLKSEVEIYVRYIVGYTPPPFPSPIYRYLPYIIPYDDDLRRTDDGWSLTIDLERSYFLVQAEVSQDEEFVESEGITLLLVTFRALVANDEWMPPGGVFDPNVLIQPGAMENVENGFGFVGGGYRLARAWTLPFEVVEKTNFRPNR